MGFKTLALTGLAAQITLTLHAATWLVTSTADGGPGSLRDIIAFQSSPGDTIRFNVTGTISLTSGEITIPWNLHVEGPGPSKLTIDANKNGRAINVTAGPLYISGVTIRNGLVAGGPGTDGSLGMNGGQGDNAFGGGIEASSDLFLSNCWFTENAVVGGPGGRGGDNVLGTGYQPGVGGFGGDALDGAVGVCCAIYNITATRCTFSSNSAAGGKGGTGGHNYNFAVLNPGGKGGLGGTAEAAAGTFTYLTNCTFSGNKAVGGDGGQGGDSDAPTAGGNGGDGSEGGPGALYLNSGGTMISCTVVSNSAFGSSGGLGGSGSMNGTPGNDGPGVFGGVRGIFFGPQCDRFVGNSIIANNFASSAHSNLLMSIGDLGFNFIGDNDDPGNCIAPVTRVGTVQSPLDPQLGPLAQNGGGLPTHEPLPNSTVIGYGRSFGTTIDERNAARPFGPALYGPSDGSDVGAVEFGSPSLGGAIGGGTNGGGGSVVVGSNFVVSWPSAYGDFTLQSSPSLIDPAAWNVVTDTPVEIGDQFVVSNTMVGPTMFYRLIHH